MLGNMSYTQGELKQKKIWWVEPEAGKVGWVENTEI